MLKEFSYWNCSHLVAVLKRGTGQGWGLFGTGPIQNLNYWWHLSLNICSGMCYILKNNSSIKLSSMVWCIKKLVAIQSEKKNISNFASIRLLKSSSSNICSGIWGNRKNNSSMVCYQNKLPVRLCFLLFFKEVKLGKHLDMHLDQYLAREKIQAISATQLLKMDTRTT